MNSSRLYTYLPKENTALTEGLLSTALSDRGFEKYRGRTGKYKKEDVLKVLDSWEPEWTRSKAISALTEPIPPDAADDFQEFARNRRLYSFDTKDLIKAKILAHLRIARKGGGTDPVDEAKNERPNWHRKKKHLLFQGVPHYMVETTGGRIPPEFVREEKQAAAVGRIKFRELADILRKVKGHVRTFAGDNFSTLSPEGEKFIASTLRPKLTEFKYSFSPNIPDSVFAYSVPAIRRKMFPRFALFKGSYKIDGAGGAALDGFGHSYAISGSHDLGKDVMTGLFTHVAQDPRQAGLYGPVLSVWNARRVPGAMNGNMRFFDNLIAETRTSPDFTQASGLYRRQKGSGHRAVMQAVSDDTRNVRGGIDRRTKLDTTRSDYLDSFGEYSTFGSANNRGEAEGLVDITRYRPSRVFLQSKGGMLDITPLARYRRSLRDKEDISAIDAVVDALRG